MTVDIASGGGAHAERIVAAELFCRGWIEGIDTVRMVQRITDRLHLARADQIDILRGTFLQVNLQGRGVSRNHSGQSRVGAVIKSACQKYCPASGKPATARGDWGLYIRP